jgi:endonuclease/exonuclease/phosphatase family metal-dependent hydrolase
MQCKFKVTSHENVDAAVISECRERAALIRFWFVAIMVVAALVAGPITSSRAESGISIMTQNMDEGTNYQELIAARSPAEFVAAVTTTYQNILATKPAERAAAIAREIMREQPDIVGLQEASIVRTGAVAPAVTVQSDLLQSLLDELANLRQQYTVVSIMPGLDAEAPSTLGFDVRLTTQDAVLVRLMHGSGDLSIANNHTQRYLTNLTVPTAIGPITLPRGWSSIDVTVDNRTFRFVSTHLDVSPAIQLAQVNELLLTAGNTTLPVVFSGDFNATADSSLDPTFATYQAVINAGFLDAWLQNNAPSPGFTCCQAPSLDNATSMLNHRIDLILDRGGFRITDIHLIGDNLSDRTRSGLWPSDHAGVVTTLRIRR